MHISRPPRAQWSLVVIQGQLLKRNDRYADCIAAKEDVAQNGVVGGGQLREVVPRLLQPKAGDEHALNGHRKHLKHLGKAGADQALPPDL